MGIQVNYIQVVHNSLKMHQADIEKILSCQYASAFRIIHRKWAIIVVIALGTYNGVRFNRLKSELTGISSKTLSDTLHDLAVAGIVKSTRYVVPEVRVEYSLTESGNTFRVALIPAIEWILGHFQSPE